MKADTTTPGGRLQYVLNAFDLTQVELSRMLKISKTRVSRYIHNHSTISKNSIDKMKLCFPDLNTQWLQHGIGTSGLDNAAILTRETHYVSKISNLVSDIERLQIENNHLKTLLHENNIIIDSRVNID